MPENPMGQEQLDSCRRDLQMALAPQGSTEHASLQVPSTHLSGSGQSLSVMQDGCGVTRITLSNSQTLSSLVSTFRSTFSVGTNESVLRTGAEDSSDGRTVLHPTDLSVVTRSGGLTGVLALVVNAGDQRTTVVIHPTLNTLGYWSDTGHEPIAPGPRVTGALGLVVGG